jgi:hypothetical protein
MQANWEALEERTATRPMRGPHVIGRLNGVNLYKYGRYLNLGDDGRAYRYLVAVDSRRSHSRNAGLGGRAVDGHGGSRGSAIR